MLTPIDFQIRSAGSSFFELRKAATAEGKAVDIAQMKKLAGSKLKLFAPIIIA
jgi:hypothetical protein